MIVIAVSLYGGFIAINYKMQVPNVLALIVVIPILSDSLFKFPSIIIDFKAVRGEGGVIDKLYQLNIQNLKGVGFILTELIIIIGSIIYFIVKISKKKSN